MIDRTLNYGRHMVADYCARVPAPDVIVDLGAGSGADLRVAQGFFPRARFVGVESYLPNILGLQQSGIECIRANIERDRLPFPDGSVDLIIANQVLEHCKEVFWIFHEVARVLKVSGHWIVGVPNLASLHNRALLAVGRQPSPIKTASAHVRGFTKADILNFQQSCWNGGYSLEGFGGSNFYPFPPSIARKLAHWAPELAWGIFFLFRKVKDYRGEFLEFPVREKLETNFWLGEDSGVGQTNEGG